MSRLIKIFTNEWIEKAGKKTAGEGKPFKAILDDGAQILGEEIPVFYGDFAEMREAELVEREDVLRAFEGLSAMFLVDEKGQAPVRAIISGRNSYELEKAEEILDKVCKVEILSLKIGGAKSLLPEAATLMRDKYINSYSKSEMDRQNSKTPETLLREKLVEYGKKLVEEGLVSGTWGNLSVRLDENNMLVTPSGIDYYSLTPKDMVKVDIHTLKWEPAESQGLKPTSEKQVHSLIYENRPEVKSVIHTHSTYCSVFAACEKDLSDKIRTAKYALPGTLEIAEFTLEALGKNRGALMSHHGMVAVGETLEEAFLNARDIEEEAEKKL